MKEIGNIVGFLVMSGVMLYILGLYWNKSRLVRRSKRWPSTLGEIIESKMVRESNDHGNHYHPKIVYRYSARGRSFEGDTVQIGVGGNTGARRKARETVNRYPVGSQVLVYFDPGKPDRACLERRGEGGWVLYVLGIVYPFLLIGVFLDTLGIGLPDIRVPPGGKKQSASYVGDYDDHSYSGGDGRYVDTINDLRGGRLDHPAVRLVVMDGDSGVPLVGPELLLRDLQFRPHLRDRFGSEGDLWEDDARRPEPRIILLPRGVWDVPRFRIPPLRIPGEFPQRRLRDLLFTASRGI